MDSIRGAHRNQVAVSTALLAQVMKNVQLRESHERAAAQRPSILTDRELEVLRLMAEGRPTRAIADELILSVNTVRSHAQNTLTKLGAHSRLEAVALARAAGLIGVDPRAV
jgi:DNA-binding NarL/FixJ family response regulator